MENSNSETETQQSFRSPPRRRRSTFFERRESLGPQPISENIDPNVCSKYKQDEKQKQNLLGYYDKLAAEKDQWKKEVTNRRHKYHDLRQQYEMATKAPSRSRISYSVLSNEDIEFVKAKVNISKLIDSQQKLHNSIRETQEIYRRANQLDNVIITYCEDKVKQVSDYILEHSTVEPVDS